MRGVNTGTKRETLLQEINNAFLQWPELDRRVFSQAHYHGKSLEAISRSLQLDVEAVSTILEGCERRLYASLRSFRKTCREEPPLVADGMARVSACNQELGIQAFAS